MRYIDKTIVKIYNKILNNIESGFCSADSTDEFFEDLIETDYIFEKKIKEEDYYLINGTSVGIGLYIKKQSLFDCFDSICNSEYYEELNSLSHMRKKDKILFLESLTDSLTRDILAYCNSKNFHLKDQIKVSNCTNFWHLCRICVEYRKGENNMVYDLSVSEKSIADFLYSMLEVYWLSESLPSIKALKDTFRVSPIYIDRLDGHFFLMKIDSQNKIGYFVSSKSLEDLIIESIDEESRLGALYANSTSDSSVVDKVLENFLIKIISKYHDNPSLYKTIPYPVNYSERSCGE